MLGDRAGRPSAAAGDCSKATTLAMSARPVPVARPPCRPPRRRGPSSGRSGVRRGALVVLLSALPIALAAAPEVSPDASSSASPDGAPSSSPDSVSDAVPSASPDSAPDGVPGTVPSAAGDLLVALGTDGRSYVAQHAISSEGALVRLSLPPDAVLDRARFAGPEREIFASAHRRVPERVSLWSGSVLVRYRGAYGEDALETSEGG